MYSIRKWIFRPKRSDTSLLAQFFYTDEELNMVAAELDSFDGRKDPERCTALVNHLRVCQDKVLNIVEKIIQEVIPDERTPRDFRVKFPDDVLQESLAGQLWFGAECLAAGSSIMNREVESASMRPLAKALTRHLDFLRTALRDQCLKNLNIYNDKIKEALMMFDRLFAEFELSYVSAMVPVKTMKEYEMMQDVVVLFCEAVNRAMRLNLLTQDMVDDYDPALMFTIPRLAIVSGLLVFPEGPLNPDMDPMSMSEMFRPFQTLLYKIRELLWTLSKEELWLLEKSLCSAEEPGLYRDLQPVQLEHLTQSDSMEVGHPDGDQPNGAKVGQGKSDSQSDSSSSSTEAECSSSGMPARGPGFLGVDGEMDYRMITHSPSTITVVANSGCDSGDDTEVVSDTSRQSAVDRLPERGNMRHQDSNDSGMLSGSEQTNPMASPAAVTKRERMRRWLNVRNLRHSRSWPEGRREHSGGRHARRVHNDIQESGGAGSPDTMGDTDNFNIHRFTYADRHGSHEFNFNLPLNTEITVQNEVISADEEAAPAPPRFIYTSRSFDTDDGSTESSTDGAHQVSFVTDTLNEVFVTDTTFRESVARSVSVPARICSCDTVTDTEGADLGVTDPASSVQCECSTSSPVTDLGHHGNCDDDDDDEDDDSEASGPSVQKEVIDTNTNSKLQIAPDHFEEKSEGEPLEKNSSSVKTNNNNKLTGKDQQCDRPRIGSFSGQDQDRGRKGSFSARFAGDEKVLSADCLDVPKIQKLKYGESVSTAMVRSHSPSVDYDWDRESYCSSDTSSYNSECNDDEEIALAIQAAELAARREARSRFRSSADLIHRLFVCISGVADQLQTNYASDLRNILKTVFECYASEPVLELEAAETVATSELQSDNVSSTHQGESSSSEEEEENRTDTANLGSRSLEHVEEAPAWVPDDESPHCSSCKVPFTFVRRRHHCRNCGKIFCGRCSSNNVPLPHYGHDKPVRVCNHCFMFQVTPFTVDE